MASPEFELTAVCTTRQESAEESAKKYGARMAFDDYRKMLAHPDIDAVAVVLRVPSHYEPTVAALNAGKHVYTEWPLGQDTAQAQEMAELARAKGVRNMVGLQARAAPGIQYAREADVAMAPHKIAAEVARMSALRANIRQTRVNRHISVSSFLQRAATPRRV